MKLSEILRAGKQRIEQHGWAQGEDVYADDYAKGYCAATALRAPIGMGDAAIDFLDKIVGAEVTGIGEWNDAPERTLPEVLAAYDKAIAAAEAQEQSK